jgi:phosphatidylinositol alpha-1,6-mannosyltransferase
VLAPANEGDAAFDATSGLEVVRRPKSIWWSSSDLRRHIRDLSGGVDAVVLGAALPMNAAARDLDVPVVLHTYGFEVAWARLPGVRAALRSIARRAALVTTLSDYTSRAIERVIGEVTTVRKLPTGVELDAFTPGADGTDVRARHDLSDRPVVVCVSRLVKRKGQDTLIKAMPAIRARVPDAALLVVGGGPYEPALRRLAAQGDVNEHISFAGEVATEDLPAHYAAGDVFAMPVRSRYAGLEVEGLGIVTLEAQACARPAITGDSGGAPEAVLDGETGLVVPGASTHACADAVAMLLGDPPRARAMGLQGRDFVERAHDWDRFAADLLRMLAEL